MRLQYFALALILVMACTSNDDSSNETPELKADGFPQRWELTAMTVMVAGVPPTTGDDMDWQEQYLLFADSTFLKSRTINEATLEQGGTFRIVEFSDGEYLELNYAEGGELIGNCSGGPMEFLRFESETQLIGTWWACDGPGLFYDRVE